MKGTFETYEVAQALVAALRPVVEALARRDRNLADQVRRAGSSVLLNLAEGVRRTGKDRLHCYRITAGSAAEVRAALQVAVAWGYLQAEAMAAVEALLDRLLAMLWLGLSPSGLHPGRASHAALFASGKWWRLMHRLA